MKSILSVLLFSLFVLIARADDSVFVRAVARINGTFGDGSTFTMEKGAVCPFIKFNPAHNSVRLLIGTMPFWTAAKNVEFVSEADTPAAEKRYLDAMAEAMAAARAGEQSPVSDRNKSPNHQLGSKEDEKLLRALKTADDDNYRILILCGLVNNYLDQGRLLDAKTYAGQLDPLVRKYRSYSDRSDRDYGDSISDANVVLGRLALKSGDTAGAKERLLASGEISGGTVLDSSGPNMSLARDLLEKKETAVVLQYFELCKKFWKEDQGKLDKWTNDIKAGRMPDFSGNLGE